MDKQKQIEEMADYIFWNAITHDTQFKEDCRSIARDLICEGYRKIPEGAVVLTREEYEKLQALKDDYVKGYEAGVDEGWDNAREETAEKFAEMVKEAIINMKWARDDTHIKLVTQGDCLKAIDEIAKEITEGKDGK